MALWPGDLQRRLDSLDLWQHLRVVRSQFSRFVKLNKCVPNLSLSSVQEAQIESRIKGIWAEPDEFHEFQSLMNRLVVLPCLRKHHHKMGWQINRPKVVPECLFSRLISLRCAIELKEHLNLNLG
jgi:hypothetical protein